jgi:hypothetical protein
VEQGFWHTFIDLFSMYFFKYRIKLLILSQ